MQPVVFDPAGLRVGQGYDVHAFAEGRKLILGGVDIPHVRGLLGHSDADVLAHAISDALLGGIRGGDIGKLFPDSDPRYAGISSLELLRQVAALLQEDGHALQYPKSFLVLDNADIDAMLQVIYEERGLTLRDMTFSKARDMIEIMKLKERPGYYRDMLAMPLEA